MAESNWFRHALQMGVFDYRRSARAIREDTARLLVMVVSVFLPTIILGGLAILFAPDLRGIDVDFTVGSILRGTVTLFWLFAVFILAQRTATGHSEVAAASFVLTTVSPRTAVLGGIIAETLRALTYVLAPGIIVAAIGAYVFATPAPLLMVPLVGCLFIVSTVSLGRVLGYAAAWLVARVPFVARHKGVLGGIASLVLFGGYAVLQVPALPIHVSPRVLSVVPIGWLVDLLAVGTPVGSSMGRAGGSTVTTVFVILASGWVATAVADSLWFGDTIDVTTDSEAATSTTPARGALARAISPLSIPVGSKRVKAVAKWVILRTRREPQRVNFLFIPVFMIIGSQVSNAVQSGGNLSMLGPAVALAIGWIVGAAFGLNPFGDEGTVLPTTLLSTSGQDFVRGLIISSVLFLPLVILLVVVTGVVGGLGPFEIVALSAIGCAVTTVGSVLAPAIGMRFPRFSAIRIGNSDGVRPPRILATVLHGLLTWVPGGALIGLVLMPTLVRVVVSGIGYLPGFLLGLVAGDGVLYQLSMWGMDIGAAIQAIPLPQFRVGLAMILIIGSVVITPLAYRDAVQQFDQYEPHQS